MLITVIILSVLLFITAIALAWHIYVTRRAFDTSLDALFNACMEMGIDLAKTDATLRAHRVLSERYEMKERTVRALREVRRQRRAIIEFMRYTREFQGCLDAAPGIHVRKDFILEYLTGAASHFTMEKI